MPSKEFEVLIKPKVDQGAVNKAQDQIQNGIGGKPIDIELNTAELQKQLKEINGSIKGIQNIIKSGFSVKGTEDVNKAFNTMAGTLEKLDQKFESIFKETGQVINTGEIKLAQGQIDSLATSLGKIETVLDQIANKSKTSFELGNQKKGLNNSLAQTLKDLREIHQYMFDGGAGRTIEYNLDSVSFRQQAADILNIGKKTDKELQQLFNSKKAGSGFSNSFQELLRSLSGHIAGNGNLNTSIDTIVWSDTAGQRIKGAKTTVQELVNSLRNMFQSVRKEGETLDQTLERIFDDKSIKNRTVSSGVFKQLFNAADLKENIGVLDAEIKEAEAREAKFSKDAVKDISAVAQALKEFIADGQGLDKVIASFEELNQTIRELAQVLDGVDLSKIATSTSGVVKKSAEESVEATRQAQKIFERSSSQRKISQSGKSTDDRYSLTTQNGLGQKEYWSVRYSENGEMSVSSRVLTSYQELEKHILESDIALRRLQEDMSKLNSAGSKSAATKEVYDKVNKSRNLATQTLRNMARSDEYDYYDSDLDKLEKEREANLKLADATREAKEEKKEYNRVQRETVSNNTAQQAEAARKVEELRIQRIEKAKQKEKELLDIEKQLFFERQRLAQMTNNRADSSALVDQQSVIDDLSKRRKNAFQSLRDNPEYDSKQLAEFQQRLKDVNAERERSIRIARADAEAKKKVANAEKEAAAIAKKAQQEAVANATKRQRAEDKASSKIQEFSQSMREMASSGKYTEEFNQRLNETANILDKIDVKGKSLKNINQKLDLATNVNKNITSASRDASNQAIVKDSKYNLDLQKNMSEVASLQSRLSELGLSTNETRKKIIELANALKTTDSQQAFTEAVNNVKLYRQEMDGAISKAEENRKTQESTAQTISELSIKYQEFIDKIEDLNTNKSTGKFKTDIETTVADLGKFDKGSASLEELKQKIKEAGSEFERLAKEAKDANNIIANPTGVDKQYSNIQKFISDNSNLRGSMRKQLQGLTLKLEGAEVTKAELDSVVQQFARLRAEAYKTGQVGTSMFDTLRGRIKQMSTNFVAMYFSFYDIIRYVRQTVSAVTELNSAMIELRKVSDASQQRIAQNFQTSARTAQDLGSTVKDVINITADWSRLNNLGLLYSNV